MRARVDDRLNADAERDAGREAMHGVACAPMSVRVSAFVGACLAYPWVVVRRWVYGRRGLPLAQAERSGLAGYFEDEVLGAVRVAEVERIAWARGARVARRLGLGDEAVIDGARAMTLGDVVLMERGLAGDPTPVLFHELVHVVQFRRLGTFGFLRAYLEGWMVGAAGEGAGGPSYRENPLEVEAYGLGERFERGERFRVNEELGRGLGT